MTRASVRMEEERKCAVIDYKDIDMVLQQLGIIHQKLNVLKETSQLDRIERTLEIICDRLGVIEREVVWASEDDDYEDDEEEMQDNRACKKKKFI